MLEQRQLGFDPKIVAFCCEQSGWLAAEQAGKLRLSYPESVRLIGIPCAGKMDVLFFLKALELGADGVILLACHKGSCRSVYGNLRAAQRVVQVKKLLLEIGIEEERITICHVAANMGHKFVEVLQATYDRLREMQPNPGRVKK